MDLERVGPADEAQKSDRGGMKVTLLGFHIQLVLKEVLKNQTNVLDVLLLGLRKNKNVVDVDKLELVEHLSQHVIE